MNSIISTILQTPFVNQFLIVLGLLVLYLTFKDRLMLLAFILALIAYVLSSTVDLLALAALRSRPDAMGNRPLWPHHDAFVSWVMSVVPWLELGYAALFAISAFSIRRGIRAGQYRAPVS